MYVSFIQGNLGTHLHHLTSHARPDPHALNPRLILHHQTPSPQNLLQRLHDTVKRRLGAFFLREAGDGDIGAAAAVEEGVELGGYGDGGDAES